MSKVLLLAGMLVSVVCVSAVSDALAGDEWKPSQEYAAVRNRIAALGRSVGLSVAERQDRLTGLAAIAQEVDAWRDRDVEGQSRIVLEVCGAMGSMSGTGLRGIYLAQDCAMRALKKADEMPLQVECELVAYVQHDRDATGKALTGEAMAELRKAQATRWLHAWQRIDRTIDKRWDPADVGSAIVTPPDGSPPGVSPDAIADPRLRAQYAAAIEAKRQKIAEATLQSRARDLMKYWTPGAKRFLITAYAEAQDRTDELRALLEQYVTESVPRAQILDAVKNKKMPEELVLRNTTRPAK